MYQRHFSTRRTHQSQPIPGSTQVKNSAGGYAWEITSYQKLDRFLILGSEGGTYYIGEHDLTVQNAQNVVSLLKADGPGVVRRVVEVSEAGRAVKNNPALFVLSLACCPQFADTATRSAALLALSRVVRTGTHLFTFLEYVQANRGWGRGLRKAIGDWYTDKDEHDLVYQVLKYRQRETWTHRDALRKAHPTALSDRQNKIFRWITKDDLAPELLDNPLILGFVTIQKTEDPKEAAKLIADYRLPREFVPPALLTSKEVWAALLDPMPMTALLRNLGNLSKVGLLVDGAWNIVETVTQRLEDLAGLKKARIHPLSVLTALKTYAGGHGFRGSGQWQPVQRVVDALDTAFYLSFDAVEPTHKRHLLGVDVSGSMAGTPCGGIENLTCAEGAAVMAMVTLRREEYSMIKGFADTFRDLRISPTMRLDSVLRETMHQAFRGTDCSLPMLYALQNKIPVDLFVVYTDSETWAGDIHPSQALEQYRIEVNAQAKLAVVGMASNGFSIANPQDAGMLDFVGFDTSTPAALAQFAAF